jgi:transcriptional regulator with XRE-family HTH domain
MSQAEVGKAMGTSQSAVARIESAQENITLDTIQRFVLALKGRLHISIPPREISLQPVRLWWEAVASAAESPWTVVRFAARTTAHTDLFIIGLERPREHTLPTASTLAPGAARLLAEGKTGV